MIDILQLINDHANAYNSIGREIPPYRITRTELKSAWPILKPLLIPSNKDVHYDDLCYFMGVKIEIVTLG